MMTSSEVGDGTDGFWIWVTGRSNESCQGINIENQSDQGLRIQVCSYNEMTAQESVVTGLKIEVRLRRYPCPCPLRRPTSALAQQSSIHRRESGKMAHNLQEPKPKDHWSSQAYSEVASFVPQLTQTVLRYLEPKSPDRILDVGCGDGKFTANFAPSVEHVLGIDASPSMIESASKDFAGRKTEFKVVDCRYLDKETEIVNGRWDKV